MKTGLRDTYSSYIDLVLVGGGHAQVQALKSFGMKPETGVRLTLITDVLNTPYSGMLPGHIEGIWSDQDIYINLVRLARFAGARSAGARSAVHGEHAAEMASLLH